MGRVDSYPQSLLLSSMSSTTNPHPLPADLLALVAKQQQDILDRLERLEKFQNLSVVKEAYTTAEAAERLGRSEWTVRQWCNKGQVQGAYKVRGKGRTGEWRLTREALTALQANGPAQLGTCLAA